MVELKKFKHRLVAFFQIAAFRWGLLVQSAQQALGQKLAKLPPVPRFKEDTAAKRFINNCLDHSSSWMQRRFWPALKKCIRYGYAFGRYVVLLTWQFLTIFADSIITTTREVSVSLWRETVYYCKTINRKVERNLDYEHRRNLLAASMAKMMILFGLLAPAQDYEARASYPQQAHLASLTEMGETVNPLPPAQDLVDEGNSEETQPSLFGVKYGSGAIQAEKLEPLKPRKVMVTVRSGDTLNDILNRNGVDRQTRYRALKSLEKSFNPRNLNVGQRVELLFDPKQDAIFNDDPTAKPVTSLAGLKIFESIERDIVVNRDESGDFASLVKEKPLTRIVNLKSSTINSSLFVEGQRNGIPNSIMAQFVDAFSYDVDFQREIQRGDRFSIFYEIYEDEDGNLIRTGDILRASLETRGEVLTVYGFQPEGRKTLGFFDDSGQSVRKALLRTPLKYGRVSSRFGMRRHPILNYSRMHTGVDFAAPRGTPIRAAGDGVVKRKGRNGGYGHYVEIRHNSTYSTAYAHLSKYRKGLRPGKRVQQGEIIGYVGSTGLSTGPHLHYEVIKNNRKVNPMTVDLPTGKKLNGGDLVAFQLFTKKLDNRVAQLEKQKIQRVAEAAPEQ